MQPTKELSKDDSYIPTHGQIKGNAILIQKTWRMRISCIEVGIGIQFKLNLNSDPKNFGFPCISHRNYFIPFFFFFLFFLKNKDLIDIRPLPQILVISCIHKLDLEIEQAVLVRRPIIFQLRHWKKLSWHGIHLMKILVHIKSMIIVGMDFYNTPLIFT